MFGWSYPPGCNGAPDDLYPEFPQSEKVYEILEKAMTEDE